MMFDWISLPVCQVWGMALLNQENRLLTGSADSELRAWDITYLDEVRGTNGHRN